MMQRMVMAAAALLLVGAAEAEAQCRRTWWGSECRDDRRDRRRVVIVNDRPSVEFGVRGGYDFQEEVGMAGTQLRIPLARGLALSPSADVFFDESDSEWQVNIDALLRPPSLGGLYGGVGVAFLDGDFEGTGDSETEVGLNLLLGLESGRVAGTTARPFAEGRWTSVEDYDAFRLALGINVPISGLRR